MISLFKPNSTKDDLIQTNGDYILDMICTSAIVTEELNGEYSFDGVFRIVKSFPSDLYENLVEESILKVTEEYGDEYFRIAKVIKTPSSITIFARNITISDILTLWCEDVRPTSISGSGAISWIYDNSIGNKLLTVSSDIPDLSTAYYQNKNVYECLFTADNCFLNRWGGETYRRGFNLAINKKVGQDRGVTIRSKKNLTGFEATTNVDNLITRIYPKGYDGITIEEKYIDSQYINNYVRIYTTEKKFEDVKVNNESIEDGFATLAEAQQELKNRVKQMYEVDKVDLLTATYKINFVELSKTEEYKNYSILEQTWLGDTVEVIEDNLGINISVRVLKRKYDVLKKKRNETELSNKDTRSKPPTIQQIATEISKMPSSDTILQIAKDNATSIMNSGVKNSYVVVRKNEILVMDTQDINTATKVWKWNNSGLGYSSNGYYGTYGTAITQDGAIVADFITTGILNAGLIRTGVIKSLNGESWLNLDTGESFLTGTIKSQNGDQFVSMDSGGINFQDWQKNEQMLRVGIAHFTANRDMNGVNFAMPLYSDFIRFSHITKADLTNGWTSNDTQYNFFDCWSSDQTVGGVSYKKGINVYSPMFMNSGIQFFSGTNYPAEILGTVSWDNGSGTIWNMMGLYGDNGTILGYKSGSSLMARFLISEDSQPGTGDTIISWGNYNFNGYTFHNASIAANYLTVSGSKNCLQKTKNYGSRLINAYETAEYYFGDLGYGQINEDGECLVYIDDIFLECVNTNAQYHVFTQVYEGAIKSIERHKTYFIVKGEANTSFSWEIKAKRIGYENNRLDVQELETSQPESGFELFSDSDFKADTSEDILLAALTFNLEDILL